MAAPEPPSDLVGVRELRQNLSVYLARVENGEALRVTDRGRIVALLAPLPSGTTALQALVSAGRATAAAGSLGELGPPAGKPSHAWSTLLAQMRDEERY
jgi:antitoxin (DNA-binding transcriptional repressor) of toxin-antitoxin stability system